MNAKCEGYMHKMEKSIEVMKQDFNTIRAGRANAAVLDRITVDYYGVPTPIQQIASISTPEPRMLAIQPWDASALKLIEKAIQSSDLGINPTNDGKLIRLVTKEMKKMAEDTKVAIRNIRRDAIDTFKKEQKASEITEDDLKLLEKEMQELTDKYCKVVDGEAVAKEQELLEI